MKELAGWMNNYFVIDKSKLSKEEYVIILGILDRIETTKEVIKAEEVTYVGGEGLPQYYEKEGKFITKDEMKVYEKIDKSIEEEEQRLLAECWEDLDKNMPKYKGISAEEVEFMKRDEERQKRNNERWEDIKQSLGYKEPVEFPSKSTFKEEWLKAGEGIVDRLGWSILDFSNQADPSRCDELKYNPDEQPEDKEE